MCNFILYNFKINLNKAKKYSYIIFKLFIAVCALHKHE